MKIVKYLFGIFAATIIGYVILGECFLPREYLNGRNICQEYQEPWYQVEADQSRTPIEVPGTLDDNSRILETVIPDGLDARVTCLMYRGLDFKAYLDGELIYTYDTSDSRWFGGNSPECYFPIPITSADAGKTLRIEIIEDVGILYQPYIGNEMGIWSFILRDSGLELFAAVVTLILGIITVVLSIWYNVVRKKKMVLGYLGFAVILVSFWLLTNSACRQLIFSNTSVASDAAFLNVMMIPFPFVIYINAIQQKRYEKLYTVVQSILLIVDIYACVTYAVGIKSFGDTFPFVTMGCVIIILALVYGIIMDARADKLKDYKYVAYGLLCMFLAAIAQITLYFTRTVVFRGTMLAIGILALLCGAAFHTIFTVFAMENEKAAALMANEAKGKFLANMSHEIRTPINAVLGMDEMILRECTDPQIREYAFDIQGAGRSLLALINDILDISKIDSGKMEIVPVEYDQSSLIHDTLNLIRQKAKEKDLELVLEMDNTLPSKLCGDDIRIRQILSNILNNAVKYTNQGKVTLKIKGIRSENSNEIMMEYRIEDTGIGIKEEDIPKLFEEFERIELSRNRSIEGTGLGMSITMQLIKLMGGSLDVKSVYGEGSCFVVRIMQGIVDDTPIGNLSERIRKQEKEYRFNQKFIAEGVKILMVDDNAINRKVLKNLLKNSLMEIEDVDSGTRCLQMITKEKYDLIFLDHMMPIMDGIETLQKFETTEGNRNLDTPVIALTANAVTGAREMYMENGFTDFLAKPIAYEKLEKLLLKYLPKEKVKCL